MVIIGVTVKGDMICKYIYKLHIDGALVVTVNRHLLQCKIMASLNILCNLYIYFNLIAVVLCTIDI